MTNKTLHRIVWCCFVIVFVLPSLLYFIVNGYLWLFNDNQLASDKMFTTFVVSTLFVVSAAAWADLEDIWR